MRFLPLLGCLTLGACHLIGGVHDAPLTDDSLPETGDGGSGGEATGTGGEGSASTIPTGLPCDPNVPCASGFCADGLCCDAACDGPCETCSDPAQGIGTCSPLEPGAAGSCGGAQLCDAFGSCVTCGDSLAPSGGDCPAWCDSCEGGVCIKSCDLEQECKQAMSCPAGWDCRVECTNKQACQDAQVICPAAERCEVVCQGEQACQGTMVQCGGGSCALDCAAGDQVCQDAEVSCSWNACEVQTCAGGENPTVMCNDACACTSC